MGAVLPRSEPDGDAKRDARPRRRPFRGLLRVLAALPFALSLAFAAATLNASFAPAPGADQLRFLPAAPPPAQAPAHHDPPVYEPSELVSV